jgi:hypothetical protein
MSEADQPMSATPSARRPEFFEEPTRLERLICAQFRRGIPIPLNPKEHQAMLAMSLEQRCDYVAKVVVIAARHVDKHIQATKDMAIKDASGG